MGRARSLIAVFTAAAGIVAGAGVASADHSWGGYHWERSTNPAALSVGDNVDGLWDGHLDVAIADWDVSAVLALTEVAGAAKRSCRPADGRIEVCADSYGDTGWLGVAQIWVKGDHITRGSARMNDFYFSMPTYDTPEWRQMVMCQEVGHLFGLDHQDETFDNPDLGTCMDYTTDPGANQHPDAHDYEQLEAIYAHLDGSGGDGGTKPCNPRSPRCRAAAGTGGSAGPGDSPGDWGRLVAAHGTHALYVRDLGGGTRLITHVIWAS